MTEAFFSDFAASFLAVARVGLVLLAAALLVRGGLVRDGQVKALSEVTVRVFLPCFIFSNITRNLEPATLGLGWTLPLFAAGVTATGFTFAWLVFRKDLPRDANLMAVSTLQSAGFLVLPIGQVLVPEAFETFALYVFLYILVHNPVLWSIGKLLVSRQPGADRTGFSWRGILTPPFIANLLALAFVFSGLREGIPQPVADSAHFLGQATVPVATFILGASLGAVPLHWKTGKKDTTRVLLVKFLLLPATMWMLLQWSGIAARDPLLGLLLLLEAAAAPATALLLAIRTYGGDLHRIGSIYIFAYAFSLVAIPFWVALLPYAG